MSIKYVCSLALPKINRSSLSSSKPVYWIVDETDAFLSFLEDAIFDDFFALYYDYLMISFGYVFIL